MFTAGLYLGITDAAINTMLADDGGLRLLKQELSRHHMEKKSLAPFDHAGQL